VARRIGLVLFVALIVLLVAATGVTIAAFFVPVLKSVWLLRLAAAALLIVAVLAGMAGSLSGWNAHDFTKRVESVLGRRLHRRSLRRIGEE
jgi:hypothetical protein